MFKTVLGQLDMMTHEICYFEPDSTSHARHHPPGQRTANPGMVISSVSRLAPLTTYIQANIYTKMFKTVLGQLDMMTHEICYFDYVTPY
jgi:hypothetical protein